MNVAWRLPTFGGFVYSLSSVPLNPHQVAVGVGDNIIRIWDTSDSSKPYECQQLWQNLKSKVTVVAFHPHQEGILAFATDDGKVGCFKLSTGKSELSLSYHKKIIYALAWGPMSKFMKRGMSHRQL